MLMKFCNLLMLSKQMSGVFELSPPLPAHLHLIILSDSQ